jgi:lipopolysaccharide transport system ATP-binding protein
MTDLAVRAANLKKVYRLYAKPAYRFLDIFGLLRSRPGTFTEHAALDGINLDIRRGEKVAIIGRNGAGKSTFLKLVTSVIQPTSGSIQVNGDVHALLQIGTGFHPDFTGRENVYAYFAQLGITGGEARRRCAEVIEFAELEEYIDQPVKTYSTGMAVRLMFSASTAITPDLLVLDEVLGVGDAYFAHKSYERMRELCEKEGTTLLLVSHDIYTAVTVCSRVIWIDRGRVLMDGDGQTVVKAYEDSIRQQEENRLRVRQQQRVESFEEEQPSRRNTLIIEVYAHENRPQPSPVYFSRLELTDTGRLVASIPLGGDESTIPGGSHVQQDATCWSDPIARDGRLCRALLNYGSPFHKVAAVFVIPASDLGVRGSELALTTEYWSELPCQLHARAFLGRREIYLGALPPSAASWTTVCLPVDDRPRQVDSRHGSGINLSGRHGTGVISVLEVRASTDLGDEAYVFEHDKPANILIRYRINKPDLRERAQVLLAFHRDGITDTCRTITRNLLFDGRTPEGTVRARLARMPLANGTYTVTVMVAQEGYYDRVQTKYFALNPEVYTCLSRAIEIVVEGGGIVGTGTGVVCEAEWTQAGTALEVAGAHLFTQEPQQHR